MYLRPAFAQTDPAAISGLIRDNPFAQLVTHTPHGIEATHLPIMALPDGDGFVLAGHFAAGNPQCAAIAAEPEAPQTPEALVIFSGPHAYISPRWYGVQPSVPTWDFAAVHVYGRLDPLTDPALIAADLQEMAAMDPVGFDVAALTPDYRARMFAGIRAFRIRPTRVEAQWKMSQNRAPADRRRVIAALLEQSDPNAAAVAVLIGQTLPPEPPTAGSHP